MEQNYILKNVMYAKKFFALISLLFLSLNIQAQYTVRVTVVDENDKPIKGATVIEWGNKRHTVTKADGTFKFYFSTPGKRKISVNSIGLKSEEFEVNDDYTGKIVLVDETKKRKEEQSNATNNSKTSIDDIVRKGLQLYKEEKYSQALPYLEKAAEQNDPIGNYYLGIMYYDGVGVTQDFIKALKYFEKAAEYTDYAYLWIGRFYYGGKGVTQNYTKAFEYYKKAADVGIKESQHQIGEMYYNGKGVAQDYTKAFEYFKKAADKGLKESLTDIGLMYYYGEGRPQDYIKAREYFKKAAEQNDARGIFCIGWMYEKGQGMDRNLSTAFSWYKKAAELNYSSAQCRLGYYYENGWVVAEDIEKAKEWYKKAADGGDQEAQKMLSTLDNRQKSISATDLYYKGNEFYNKKDYAQALKYYMQSSDLGNEQAACELGRMYEFGEGVKKNISKAIDFYKIAAEKGNYEGQDRLGKIYLEEGPTQDYEQAFYWIKQDAMWVVYLYDLGMNYMNGYNVQKNLHTAYMCFTEAAEHGNIAAQYELGEFYENGWGTTKDIEKAKEWYRKAAEGGISDAQKRFEALNSSIKKKPTPQPQPKDLATIEWINYTEIVNKKEYQLKIGVKSKSKVEEVNIIVNGTQSRGINTVKSDGYDQTINRTLTLNEGANNIVVSVRNSDGTAFSTNTITYQASNTLQEVSTGKRIALVMGNSDYAYSAPLKNPVNDATDIANKLESLGFEVIRSLDQNRRGMETAINEFGIKALGYETALFFYAGHGISYKGSNYMIPIDANLAAEEDVEYDCTNASRVLAKMEKANCKMKILILDACRNLPSFARSWHRSIDNSGGFNRMDAPKGTFIAYATAEGDVAQDGIGRNSPYTSALLKALDIPNMSISDLFQEVGDKVVTTTNEKQNPWVSSSIRGKFIFNMKQK